MAPNIWGIHAGKTGDASTLFLKKNCIAIGWDELGDLSTISNNREAFKTAVKTQYPNLKPGAIPNNAGQLFRFTHDIKEGDWVIFPEKVTRIIHFGEVTGPYQYKLDEAISYPNRRPVKWFAKRPRTKFSQGALYEIGSAMSLFMVKNYAEEFQAIANNSEVVSNPVIEDESVAAISSDITENTRDYIIKRLSQDLKGLPLEGFIVHLLECMGYVARLTKRNEPSVDIIAHKDQLGVEPPIIKIQVKSSSDTVSDRDVSALYGKLSAGDFGLFITLGTFSNACLNIEKSKPNLRLIDGDDLVKLILDHYDKFDSHHKGILPLRRVYIPNSPDQFT